MILTDITIRRVQPGNKTRKIFDSGLLGPSAREAVRSMKKPDWSRSERYDFQFFDYLPNIHE